MPPISRPFCGWFVSPRRGSPRRQLVSCASSCNYRAKLVVADRFVADSRTARHRTLPRSRTGRAGSRQRPAPTRHVCHGVPDAPFGALQPWPRRVVLRPQFGVRVLGGSRTNQPARHRQLCVRCADTEAIAVGVNEVYLAPPSLIDDLGIELVGHDVYVRNAKEDEGVQTAITGML